MGSLKDFAAISRLPGSIALAVVVISLSGCVSTQSRTYSEPEEPLVFNQYEGMSAEEIAAAGDEAWREGEVENAIFSYMQSLALADDPDVWLKVGRLQQHSGQIEFAWQSYSRVIELDPQNAEGHERIGMLFLSSKQKDLATEHLKIAVELDERRWVANNALGVLADASGEYEAAIGYYEAALEQHPRSAMLLTNMGYSYYLAGQLEEAEKLFKLALGIDRAYVPAKKNLGLARARSGQYDSAVKILENVMDRPQALNDAGYIAFINGDMDEARRLLNAAIRLSPSYYKVAYENLDRVKQAQAEIRPRAEEFESGATDITYQRVAADRLNVRRSDGIDAPVVGFLTANNQVRALEQKGDWTFVSYVDESGGITLSGWVMTEYLTTASE